MKRVAIVLPACSLLVALMVATRSVPVAADRDRHGDHRTFDLVETTIPAIQDAIEHRIITSRQLVQMYLNRIAAYDRNTTATHLNSYIHLNRGALDDENGRDRDDDGDRDGDHGHHRQPLRGIPIILKDNINTRDMPTTAGSAALAGSIPPHDAFIARKLREAGAIILGKGSLTEFANFLTAGMPAGYSSQLRQQLGGGLLVGYGFNPFDPRPDPRAGMNDGRPALSPGGSSSGPGIAVAANLAAVGVGTETSGSILSPGNQNLVVGIKPTVGLVSRDGIIPITADQDTAGPLSRTVADAARLLGVLAGFDPGDFATGACLTAGNCFDDYTRFLDKHALRRARIAVPHFGYWTDNNGVVNLSLEQQRVMNDAIAVLRAEGAIVEDPHEIPTQQDLINFPGCGALPIPPVCSTVLLYGFKRDLNAYLASLGSTAPVHTLADVIAFNTAHASVALKYGQVLAIAADSLNTSPGSADTMRYLHDRALDLSISRGGLDAIYNGPDGLAGTRDDVDAILFPANRGANIAARAGYPSIVVPAGFVPNPAVPPPPTPPPTPFPPGFDAKPAPYSVAFSGRAFSEPRLIGLAYAFEQATHHRVRPSSVPPLSTDHIGR
jgi:amidase